MKNKILMVALSVSLAITIALSGFYAQATASIQVGDTNGDGEINLTDLTHLAQYLAGWDVELGVPSFTESEPSESGSDQTYDDFDNANEDNIYQNAPTGFVHVLMNRNWHESEQLLIKQYEQLTGVKVMTTLIAEKDYATKLVSMITSGDAPDIVYLSTGSFPGLVTKAMQPLDAETFQLNSDCWNKQYMDAYKINGRYFGVAMPQSWLCEDLNYVTYYNPQLLKSIGVTTMPYDLYKQGKWNWETQEEIMRKAKAAGKVGLEYQSSDVFMHSAGQDFVSYDGSQFNNLVSGATSGSLLTSAWAEVATLNSENLIGDWNINDVVTGKSALNTAITYGLYKESNWYNESVGATLNAVPVAGPKGGTAYTPVKPKTWGVPKTAKNAKGAAYFLRYFLDIGNFDFDSTFYNDNFKEVFKTVTSSSAKKSIMYGSGVSDYVDSTTYKTVCNALVGASPQNVTSVLNQVGSYISSPIVRANKDLAKIK